MSASTQPALSQGVLSLLSLSVVAASAEPIPTANEPSSNPSFSPGSFNGPSSLPAASNTLGANSSKVHQNGALKHRRMSSTGLTKRRLSDAREATIRPSAVSIQTAAAALSSLATLSLSGSPPPQTVPQTSTSFTSASGFFRLSGGSAEPPNSRSGVKEEDDDAPSHESTTTGKNEVSIAGISIKGTGKKRGTIFKCESCSKVYRHPSCLIKHRWEHSPHWREASKFLLSKHQQVQLLEAAAILSHLSPSAAGGTSLPEDRSLWPSFLSGGLLPPPAGTSVDAAPTTGNLVPANNYHLSSSMPATSSVGSISRSSSAGPRMHDYSLPSAGGLTQVRPGIVGVSTSNDGNMSTARPSAEPATIPRAQPVPVPINTTTYRDQGGFSYPSGTSDPWGSPVSLTYAQSSYSGAHSYGTGGWSLPKSSIRSASVSDSRSRSGSAPKSDEEGDDYVEIDPESLPGEQRYGFASRGRMSATRDGWHDVHMATGKKHHEDKIDEEWDGMEMEMEM